MDSETNESVHSKFCMSSTGEGIEWVVIVKIQCSTLSWFGHIEKIPESNDKESVHE